MTVVDRATKRVTLIPVHESVTAAGAADLFLQWVVWCYGMPQGGHCRLGPPFHVNSLLAVTVHRG